MLYVVDAPEKAKDGGGAKIIIPAVEDFSSATIDDIRRSRHGDKIYTPLNKEGGNPEGEGVSFTSTGGADFEIHMKWFSGLAWRFETSDFSPFAPTGQGTSKQSVLLQGEVVETFSHQFIQRPAYHSSPNLFLEEKPSLTDHQTSKRWLVYNWHKECWTHLSIPAQQYQNHYVIYSDNKITEWPSPDRQEMMGVDGGDVEESVPMGKEYVEYRTREKKESGQATDLGSQYIYYILDKSTTPGSAAAQIHPGHIAYWASWAAEKGHKFGNLTRLTRRDVATINPLTDFHDPKLDDKESSIARINGVQDHFVPLNMGNDVEQYGVPVKEGTETPFVPVPDQFHAALGTFLVSNNKYIRPESFIPTMYPDQKAHQFSSINNPDNYNNEDIHWADAGPMSMPVPRSDPNGMNADGEWDPALTLPKSGEDRKQFMLQWVWQVAPVEFKQDSENRIGTGRLMYFPMTNLPEADIKAIGWTNPLPWKGLNNDPTDPNYGKFLPPPPE
jgi:hypothetical protein